MPLSPTKTLVTHVNKVTAKLNNDILTGAYSSYACLLGFNEKEYKSRKAQSFLKKCLLRQIAFIQYCSTCKILANGSMSNLAAIKKWVTMQMFTNKTNPSYIILFYLSSGVKIFTFVDDLKEIDFADIYSSTFFEAIAISNHTWPYLTKQNLKKTLASISEDMAYDGYNIHFDIPEEYLPNKNNPLLFAQCQIDGMPSIDKIAKIQKTNELYNTDILKLFAP
jgi:hypothetical protein